MTKKNESVYDAENSVFEKYNDKSIVNDGLCWSDICDNPEIPMDRWKEIESIYLSSPRRPLFLAKEPNKNEDEDYRDWHWSERKGNVTFGDCVAMMLEGLLKTTKTYCPTHEDLRQDREIFKEFPLALVNVKKTPGSRESDWKEIFSYAQDHASLLREQLDILNPNIIVCCGSTDDESSDKRTLRIAEHYIYPEFHFVKVNNFCSYCAEHDLLLIDSYHPSYVLSKEEKIDKMLFDFCEFLRLYK